MNNSTACVSLNVDVSGVAAGNQAALVFSNGSSVRASALPSPGTLAAPPAAAGAPEPLALAALPPDPGLDVEPADAGRLAAHAELLRLNRQMALRLRPAAGAPRAADAQLPAPLAAPAVGSTRTWTETYGNTGTYATVAKATCALPSGRTAVFWVDPNATSRGSVTDANLAYFQTVFCGSAGGYADVVAALGDVWGPAAGNYTNIIHDAPGALLDFNVAILQVPAQSTWSGYFSASNNFLRSDSPGSNEALVFFIDASQVAASYAYIGSTLLHEMTHMVNFYQRDIVRGTGYAHDTWLEETTAMMTEDIVTPAVSPGRYSTIPGQRVRFYVASGGAVSLLEWDYPVTDSYAVGGSLAGLLDRKYGTALWSGSVACPAITSHDCLDGLIRSAGGAGFADEFARLGATIFGLVPAASTPAGYGFPLGTWGAYTLDAIDPMTWASRRPATATALGLGFSPGTHTYQLDTIPSGATRYRRTGVSVPAGTSLMLVIK